MKNLFQVAIVAFLFLLSGGLYAEDIQRIVVFEDEKTPVVGVLIEWGLKVSQEAAIVVSRTEESPEEVGFLFHTKLKLQKNEQQEGAVEDPFSPTLVHVGWISYFAFDKSVKKNVYVTSQSLGLKKLSELLVEYPVKVRQFD